MSVKPYKGFEPKWVKEPAPSDSYRSIFRWGDPNFVKYPKESLYKMMKEIFHLTDDDFKQYDRDIGFDKVELNIPSKMDKKHIDEFKKIVGDPNVNVHKIRTFRGTLLFIEQVEKAKIPSSQTEAARIYKVISEKVGKALNHVRRTKDGKQKAVGTTAQQNYIDPSVQIKFFAENGFRVPPKLERYLDSE